jgi:hypothetical protein
MTKTEPTNIWTREQFDRFVADVARAYLADKPPGGITVSDDEFRQLVEMITSDIAASSSPAGNA